jgi:Family of unknown function (DUF6459)
MTATMPATVPETVPTTVPTTEPRTVPTTEPTTEPERIPAARTVVRRLPDLEAAAANPARAPRVPAPRRPEPPTAVPAGRPDRVRVHAHLVLRQVMEVLDGRRPAGQLADVVTEPVLRYLAAAAGRLDDPGYRVARTGGWRGGLHRDGLGERTRAAGLRSMRVCHPADGVAEISVVWRYRGRSRALAARFEQAGRVPRGPAPNGTDQTGLRPGAEPHWRCTALRLG